MVDNHNTCKIFKKADLLNLWNTSPEDNHLSFPANIFHLCRHKPQTITTNNKNYKCQISICSAKLKDPIRICLGAGHRSKPRFLIKRWMCKLQQRKIKELHFTDCIPDQTSVVSEILIPQVKLVDSGSAICAIRYNRAEKR